MEPVGRTPYWRPARAGDWILVSVLGALHVLFYAPLRLAHLALGRTRASWLILDLLSAPGKAMLVAGSLFGERGRSWGRKANALEHTELVCRLCPASRQALRDPTGNGACAWNRSWNEGRFDIPPDFGPRNYVMQFRGRTDLRAFADLSTTPAGHATGKPRWSPPPAAMWLLSLAAWAAIVFGILR